jgi:hypothetical protein
MDLHPGDLWLEPAQSAADFALDKARQANPDGDGLVAVDLNLQSCFSCKSRRMNAATCL